MKVVAVVPRHVQACSHSPDQRRRWFVHTWNRASPEKQTRVPYCCNSWRCEVCRRHEAAVTFARIKQATDPLPPEGWCFLVLTLDRNGYFGGKRWADVNAAYRQLGTMVRATLGRIGRLWGPETKLERSGRSGRLRTVRALGNRWVAVVEAHRSGWPHVNLLVWCPELAEELRRGHSDALEDPEVADAVALAQDAWKRGEPVPERVREMARRSTLATGAVRSVVEAAGWGRQSTAEAARSAASIAGYVVKLAGQHDASVGELAKITQAPTNAPERFRRLRSGKGFLPPRYKDPEVTGCLVRRRRTLDCKGRDLGTWEIEAVNASKEPDQAEAIERAIGVEHAIIREEEELRRMHRKLPPMPPLRHSYGGKLEGHRETSERRHAMLQRELAACG